MAKFEWRDLLKDRLVTVKFDQERNLKIIKYSKRVFYDHLWHTDSRLLQARGIVLDAEDNIVSRPFDKVFNLGECNTFVEPNKTVWAHKKINGFLINVTYISALDYMCVHTTGTFDSEFVALGRKWLESDPATFDYIKQVPDVTFMFEVCDESDPHIIKEDYGLHYLACRDVVNGRIIPSFCNAQEHSVFPLSWKFPTGEKLLFCHAIKRLKECRHEGFVCYAYDHDAGGLWIPLVKLKSPHYLITKFLGRNNKSLATMLADPVKAREKIDEEFYDIVEWLAKTYGPSFIELDEQERIGIVKKWFDTLG